MAVYQYKAIDSQGKRKTGQVNGTSREMARTQLARMRLKVIKLEDIKKLFKK